MNVRNLYSDYFGVNHKLLELANSVELILSDYFREIDKIRDVNQLKVISAMQKNRLSDIHFNPSTGYGYGDIGREKLDNIYADVFNAEAAFVRQQIASGTHAIALSLFACLRPGDEILSVTGKPYDTLDDVIGINGKSDNGSLADYGVSYKQVEMRADGGIDIDMACKMISKDTKVAYFQKSKGYTARPALSNAAIEKAVKKLKTVKNDLIVVLDNCYGEFVETSEPVEYGVDLMAGSLIKNPGGGIATSGGYIAGRADLIEKAAYRFIAPGIGLEIGSNPVGCRHILQGLFLAPHIVAESLKGSLFCAVIMDRLNFKAEPAYNEKRYDIIQSVEFNDPENIILFCRGIQKAAAVDSYVTPEPWAMPGYDCEVIMAAGGFIQGSSIELSADAPLRPPYIAYMQGGLVYLHAKLGVLLALQEMINKGKVVL